MDLNNSVVLVTGASSGIGTATAQAASRAGARVVLVARREDRIRQFRV
jgi:NADP-dependent 3-hydroxy acid dehydrogenase YdfG